MSSLHRWAATKTVVLPANEQYPQEKKVDVAWICLKCGLVRYRTPFNRLKYGKELLGVAGKCEGDRSLDVPIEALPTWPGGGW